MAFRKQIAMRKRADKPKDRFAQAQPPKISRSAGHVRPAPLTGDSMKLFIFEIEFRKEKWD